MRFSAAMLVLSLSVSVVVAAPANFDSSRPIEAQISVNAADAFSPSITYSGPYLPYRVRENDNLLINLFLDRDRKTNAIEWSVVLQAEYYHDWRRYETAALLGGEYLKAKTVDRKVLDCSYRICHFIEASYVVLSPQLVKASMTGGLKMKWIPSSGGSGAFVADIPAEYFAAMARVASGAYSASSAVAPAPAPTLPPRETPRATTPGVQRADASGLGASGGGTSAYQVERLPEVLTCNPRPAAFLNSKGPGFEIYGVSCANASGMLEVRCEMGNCRVMR